MAAPTFIADVHLGKLAKMLRMLGIDTVYENNYTKEQLLLTARKESRVLLSRNSALALLHNVDCFIITDEQPEAQLKEVLEKFKLRESLRPFTRCQLCNGVLRAEHKEHIAHLLQPDTARYFHAFWQCSKCNHVYWKGSHYVRMLQLVQKNRGV